MRNRTPICDYYQFKAQSDKKKREEHQVKTETGKTK
jgi:hypothetical protein